MKTVLNSVFSTLVHFWHDTKIPENSSQLLHSQFKCVIASLTLDYCTDLK